MTIRRAGAVAIVVLSFMASLVRAVEPPIIAKARDHLGGEAALNAVQSIHYTGRIFGPDPTDPKKQTSAAIEIIVQKQYQYRVTVTSDQIIDTTALDGYDGWNRRTAAADPKRWQQTLQGPDQIKRLRANAWENISFFSGLAAQGGTVEDQGPTTIEGIPCQKVAFIHTPTIVYFRYFDQGTGRLVFSETETGGTIREQGEILVNGIRFPKTLVSVSKGDKTEGQTVTITFDKITVNEKFPGSFFAVPSLQAR